EPMFRRLRARSRLAALILVASLLFQQVAVAAYACARESGVARQVHSHCAESAQTRASPLCEKHCVPDLPVAPDASVPGVPALPVTFDFALMLAQTSAAMPPREAMLPTGADPPPRLRFCSLLI